MITMMKKNIVAGVGLGLLAIAQSNYFKKMNTTQIEPLHVKRSRVSSFYTFVWK
jgi:hypothetical protein